MSINDLIFPIRIDEDSFVGILRKNGSPSAPFASFVYEEIVQNGIDPCFLLAIFAHENDYGNTGLCREYSLKNPGDVRTSVTGLGTSVQTPKGTFQSFPSWLAGWRDLAQRFHLPPYSDTDYTIVEILELFAPSSDGNDPLAYAEEVAKYIQDNGTMPASKITMLGPDDVIWNPIPAVNWDTNRDGISLIVIHDIEGGAQSALSRFDTPTGDASAHIVVGDPGNPVYYQCVDFNAVAYATGNYHVNQRSLNIELPGYAGKPYDPDVLAKAAAMVGYWSRAYGIPLTKLSLSNLNAGGTTADSGMTGICGHQDVPDPNNVALGGGKDNHTDPGSTFPWSQFLAMAQAGGGLVEGGGLPTAEGAYFRATGFALAHGFWQYWRANGGLSRLGFPLTREYTDYAGIVVQWTERARLEWHPGSSTADFDVMLGLVGEELIRAIVPSIPATALIPQTGI